MIYDPMYKQCTRGHVFLAACELGQAGVFGLDRWTAHTFGSGLL